ncbi:iron-sulfur cluster assembly accessory protein [Aromatoleum toluvorans]|uniref:Iron-sulfur cluster assembly accessory protein n=1 Tax=Aromatoleum toluvorans TaxID=92002 RepID=A0ABX1PXK1_9RHOO|nr:iron-sulfur cluster assembly accessory protein [Aromatoleum toluvorans]NMG43868.1 iron-sulfur cluster assembly accessory protein [Aromatoleum toluvorans]
MNITITPAAEKFMRRMVRFGGGGPDAGFRLQVSAGGCSGYASEFDVAAPRSGDATLDWNGLKLILPAESRLLLEGVTIDFADTPTSSGLTFINPNAASCGCSTSAPAGPAGVTTVSIDSIRRKA